MKVLVATASKHGATTEVGDAIAEVIANEGYEVVRSDARAVSDLAGVEAVILGSGIYGASWTKEAEKFVSRFGTEMTDLPRWAFSCGPLGDPLRPTERPSSADATAKRGGMNNRIFPGRVVRADLSGPERLVLKMLKAPEGDYRDWDDIRAWAREITESLAR